MNLKKLVGVVLVSAIILIGSSIGLSFNGTQSVIDRIENYFEDEIILDEHEVKIVRVVDGDTVIVRTEKGLEERIRLLLIDTPESVHPEKEKELFGEEASDYAKEILRGGDVVTLEVGNPERDKYNRVLAYIWVDDVNFNQLMIEKGYARVGYIYEPNTKYLKEFKKAESEAEKRKENIWSIDGYVTDEGFDMSVVD